MTGFLPAGCRWRSSRRRRGRSPCSCTRVCILARALLVRQPPFLPFRVPESTQHGNRRESVLQNRRRLWVGPRTAPFLRRKLRQSPLPDVEVTRHLRTGRVAQASCGISQDPTRLPRSARVADHPRERRFFWPESPTRKYGVAERSTQKLMPTCLWTLSIIPSTQTVASRSYSTSSSSSRASSSSDSTTASSSAAVLSR